MKQIYIILLFLLLSCQAMIDSPLDLGHNYVFYNQAIYKTGSTSSQYVIPLEPAIPPEIVAFNWNDMYIIAKQVPNQSRFVEDTAYMSQRYKDSALIAFRKQSELGICFWIIDKCRDTVYEVMDSIDYNYTCNLLSITLNLVE